MEHYFAADDVHSISVSTRGMATEKQIMGRINATKNISKITQSMKMVSAAKLRGDQARLAEAQPFNVSDGWDRSLSKSKLHQYT